jgi:hypothetical protein
MNTKETAISSYIVSLVKRTYVDQETVITAGNLNDIQDAIIQNEEDIATNGTYSKPSGGIPASDMTSGVQTSLGKADTAYQKPSGGIPSTDMASAIQTSLGKADSAYQKPSGGIPATDLASAVQTSLSAADTAYQKPSGGIPSTDLASAVQTSLGKADTALQSSDIDNTLTVTGKAADAKAVGDALGNKVDKVSGKQLSTEDYTTEEKTKLGALPAAAPDEALGGKARR